MNSLVFILSSLQLVMALNFLVRVFGDYWDSEEGADDEMFTSWLGLAILALTCMLVSLFGICAAQKVTLLAIKGKGLRVKSSHTHAACCVPAFRCPSTCWWHTRQLPYY